MKLLWPPRALGFGTPLNLASMAPDMRPVLRRWVGLAPLVGVIIVSLIAAIDLLLFRGVTVQRLAQGAGGTHPPVATRVVISFYGSVLEELLFRVFLATVVAWLTYLALSLFIARPKLAAQWAGTLAAAAIMGLWWHLGGRTDLFTVARVLTTNMVLGSALGWVYWSKGLEAAMMTHTVVYLCLFFAIPALF